MGQFKHIVRSSWRGLLEVIAVFGIVLVLAHGNTATNQAAAAHEHYAPIIAQNAQVSQALPDTLDVALPFTVLDSDESNLTWWNGAWWFTAYRVDSGDLNGGWLLRFVYEPGVPVKAQAVQKLPGLREFDAPAGAELQVITPIGRYSPARIDLSTNAPDAGLYVASFPSTNGRARVLQVTRVHP